MLDTAFEIGMVENAGERVRSRNECFNFMT